jgi:hypothetical protein
MKESKWIAVQIGYRQSDGSRYTEYARITEGEDKEGNAYGRIVLNRKGSEGTYVKAPRKYQDGHQAIGTVITVREEVVAA